MHLDDQEPEYIPKKKNGETVTLQTSKKKEKVERKKICGAR